MQTSDTRASGLAHTKGEASSAERGVFASAPCIKSTATASTAPGSMCVCARKQRNGGRVSSGGDVTKNLRKEPEKESDIHIHLRLHLHLHIRTHTHKYIHMYISCSNSFTLIGQEVC